MPNATPSLVLISAQPQTPAADVRDLVRAAGFGPIDHLLGSVPPVPFQPLAAAIVCPADVLEPAIAQTKRWRVELGDTYLPVVWILGMPSTEWAKAGLDAGADACFARPLDDGLFLAQLHALRRIRGTHDRLRAKGEESQIVTERLRKTYEQIDRDLNLVRTLHRALRPDGLPESGPVRFGLFHRPRSRSGGDFFDAWPAGDDLEFFLADAAGPFGPFIKQRLLAASVRGPAGAPPPPGDVLRRVNRALIHLKLDDPPLASMALVRVTPATGRLTFARAGLPYPIFVPAAGPVEPWPTPGPMLGVFEAEFPTHAAELKGGDKLLLASDGTQADGTPDPTLLLAAAAAHRHLPARAFAEAVADDVLQRVQPADDFTLLAAERVANS